MTDSPCLVAAEAPGVQITACSRGAHLMTWTTDGVQRLWMSPVSGCGSAGAIRGGVPVLFPQFGTFGHLPKHGFARTADWRQVAAPEAPGSASLAFELTDSEETRAVWPHAFRARLEVVATATDLRMGLVVDNLGPDPASFTGGLHSYFSVCDPDAWIGGLAGCHAWDGRSTEQPAFTARLGASIPALAAQDLVITGAVAPVVLNDAVLGRLSVAAQGFPNRVVWNPGPGHGLADVVPGDEAGFVCIEPTSVVPITLPGHGTWEGRQHVHLG